MSGVKLDRLQKPTSVIRFQGRVESHLSPRRLTGVEEEKGRIISGKRDSTANCQREKDDHKMGGLGGGVRKLTGKNCFPKVGQCMTQVDEEPV